MKKVYSALAVAAAAALSVFAFAAFATSGVGTGGKGGGCTPESARIDVPGENMTWEVTAPEGKLISGYCVAGGGTSQLVTVDPAAEKVVISSAGLLNKGGKQPAISHYILILVDKPQEPVLVDLFACVEGEVALIATVEESEVEAYIEKYAANGIEATTDADSLACGTPEEPEEPEDPKDPRCPPPNEDGSYGGKDGKPGNDECVADPKPETPVTPEPPVVPPVEPPVVEPPVTPEPPAVTPEEPVAPEQPEAEEPSAPAQPSQPGTKPTTQPQAPPETR
jgi:hypothetical protein